MILKRGWFLAPWLFIGPLSSARAIDVGDFNRILNEYLGHLQPVQVVESPLSAGLPDKIPADFLEREGFLAFDEIPEEAARRMRAPRPYALAPIASLMRFNGTPIDPLDRTSQRQVFDESTYAMIPLGTKIRVSATPAGEVWEYPTGTIVAHRIALRSVPPRIFELRLVRKMPDGRWAFGSYSPADLDDQTLASTLRLNAYPDLPEASFHIWPSAGLPSGVMTTVALKRIRLSSCRGCHFSNSTADYQYARHLPDGRLDVPASIAAAGPCGFVPNNPSVRGMWAQSYSSKNGGRSPFE